MTAPIPPRITAATVTMPRNIPLWRPFQPLTQAQYNALVASGGFDPNTLYAVTPKRVMLGGQEIWPGPWDGGVVNVASGVSPTSALTLDVPISTAGNLLVACFHRSQTGNGVTAITDTAQQTWVRAGQQMGSPRGNSDCWYCVNAASINRIVVSGGASPTACRYLELEGLSQATDVVDSVTGYVSGVINAGVVPVAAEVTSPSFVVFTATGERADVTASVITGGVGWQTFDYLQTPLPGTGGYHGGFTAVRHAQAGEVVTGTWTTTPTIGSYLGMLAVAFRTATVPIYVPPSW
jgi:hypothetical protein